MKPEAELCDQLTTRIESAMTLRQSAYNAVAMRQSAREIAHIILPIVLAYETKARADERAKVAEEVYEADYAHLPLWADDEELAEGHFADRDLTWWMNALGHPKAHNGCCKTCGCATTCMAGAFFDAVTATAARIARGGA